MGKLASIVYKPVESAVTNEFVRVPVAEARLVVGHGIEGDAKGGEPDRHLNIVSAEKVRELGSLGFDYAPGAFGEQLRVDGIDIDGLAPGTRLRFGAEALVELVRPRQGCARFEKSQQRSREETAGRLGMMAVVVESGEIRVGDEVWVIT